MTSGSPPSVVADRFEIERVAGAGAMGTVFRARDRRTGDVVAVKVVGSPLGARRFAREAAALAQIAHPAIVRYVDHGETADGGSFLVMEWLEGVTLEHRLEAGRLGLGPTLVLTRRMAEALAEAHRHGIVHRDVKPANVMLPEADVGLAKLVDLGLARRSGLDARITHTGAIMGTPLYMSPEQVRAKAELGASTDVFSLGVMAYEMLTGRTPFGGETVAAVLAKILLDSPPLLSPGTFDGPPALAALVHRMLDKEEAQRPTAAEVVKAITDLIEMARTLDSASTILLPSDLVRTQPAGVLSDRNLASSARASAGRVTIGSGEQRVVSVVMTGARAGRLPDDARAELDAALERVVAERAGRLERLIDGSFLITFGAAAAPTDQAVAAARCALIIAARMPEVAVAVATGWARIGAAGPIGDVIDRAAALLTRAGSTPARVDAQTADLLEGRFDIAADDDGLLALRREHDLEEAPRTLLGRRVPCVGRERELGALLDVFRECADEGVARAALVTAPPGIGKSRLRHELVRRLRESGAPFEVLQGRADSLRGAAPLATLAAAVRQAAGITGAEPMAEQRARLGARIGRSLRGEQAARVTEWLGEMAGVSHADQTSPDLRAGRQDPRVMAEQIQAAILEWLEAETQLQPVLVVLEDLHWGDLPTVQLLDAALRVLGERPFMVLALARPEVQARFPSLWSGRPLTHVHLGPLMRRASERLVIDVLGDRMDATARERLVALADGNAFYLEELIRAVAEGVAEGQLPDTVVGMAQARLDALGTTAKMILRVGSVFGDSFQLAGVRALLGGAIAGTEVAEWIRILVEREVLAAKGGREADELAFRHGLLRDAAYALLPAEECAAAHALAAEWLESNGERQAVVIAGHFERGAEPERAARWWARAAHQALQADDLPAALAHAERAERGGVPDGVLGELAFLRSEVHQWRGENEAASHAAEDAMALLPPGSGLWLRAAGNRMMVVVRGGRLADAVEMVSLLSARGAAELDPDGVIGLAVAAYAPLAQLMPLDVGPMFAPAAAAPRGRNASADGWVHRVEGLLRSVAGDVGGALEGNLREVASFRAAADLRNLGTSLLLRAGLCFECGALTEGRQAAEEACAITRRLGLFDYGATMAWLGWFAIEGGEPRQALAHGREALRIVRGFSLYEAFVATMMAQAHAAEGDPVAALSAARSAVARVDEGVIRASALAMEADLLLAGGAVAAALAAARAGREALASAGATTECDMPIRLALAEALWASGALEEARVEIAAARAHLIAGARTIADPTMRGGWLHGTSHHARVMARAKEWLGDSG